MTPMEKMFLEISLLILLPHFLMVLGLGIITLKDIMRNLDKKRRGTAI